MYYLSQFYGFTTVIILLNKWSKSSLENNEITSQRCYAFHFPAKEVTTRSGLNIAHNESDYYNGPIRFHYIFFNSFLKKKNSQYFIAKIFPHVEKRLASVLHVKKGVRQVLRIPIYCKDSKYKILDGKIICLTECTANFCNIYNDTSLFDGCYVMENEAIKTVHPPGEGVKAKDYIIFVNSERIDAVTSKGYGCALDEFDRPIAGILNIAPGFFDQNINENVLVYMILHQYFHMLGFADHLLAFKRKKDGTPLVQRNELGYPTEIVENLFISSEFRDRIITRKNVKGNVEMMKINCLDIPSLYKVFKNLSRCLENLPSFMEYNDKKAYTHLSERIYGPEIMTSVQDPLIDSLSIITLHHMDSMGWYTIFYENADAYYYLTFANCVFFSGGIIEFIEMNAGVVYPPYCNTPFIPGRVFSCSTWFYYSYCDLLYILDDRIHSYFDKLNRIGYPLALDYHGNRTGYESYPTLNLLYTFNSKSSHCLDVTSHKLWRNINYLRSYYGNDSRCFDNYADTSLNAYYGAACHKIEYLNSTSFTIWYENDSYICHYSQRLKIIVKSLNLYIDCGSEVLANPNASNIVPFSHENGSMIIYINYQWLIYFYIIVLFTIFIR